MLNISILPQKAQIELFDFYQLLVKRYVTSKRKLKSSGSDTQHPSKSFFDQYSIDLTEFRFNRNDIYER